MKTEQTFEEYIISAKNSFVETIVKWFPHEVSAGQNKAMRSEIRVASENIIIAYDQLREGLNQSKWISVKTELPEKNQLVLCTNTEEDSVQKHWVVAGQINDDGLWYNQHQDKFSDTDIRPTHWQPLPQPPSPHKTEK